MTCDLSVITATWRRANLLGLCLEQFAQQSLGSLRVEHIVVSDGPDRKARALAAQHGARYLERAAPGGQWGAFAKDTGIAAARGEYVCFWDDDNCYHPHALATLFSAAYGYDVGVARTVHWDDTEPVKKLIPRRWTGTFELGNVDTMCVCVRTDLARTEAWGQPAGRKGTDYHWLKRLEQRGARVRFVPVVIGVHL